MLTRFDQSKDLKQKSTNTVNSNSKASITNNNSRKSIFGKIPISNDKKKKLIMHAKEAEEEPMITEEYLYKFLTDDSFYEEYSKKFLGNVKIDWAKNNIFSVKATRKQQTIQNRVLDFVIENKLNLTGDQKKAVILVHFYLLN